MTATTNDIEPILIEKIYKHPIESVFKAFSNKSAFQNWIAPSVEIGTRILLHDFKVGGHYRIEFSVPAAGTSFLSGEYIKIDYLKQVCFTWVWEKPDVHAGIDSLVSVDFLEDNGNTKLVITHENLSTLDATQRHVQGWKGTLNRLNQFLSQQD